MWFVNVALISEYVVLIIIVGWVGKDSNTLIVRLMCPIILSVILERFLILVIYGML